MNNAHGGELENIAEQYRINESQLIDFIVYAIKDYPNLICIRSLTKIFAIPGLRLGYLIATEAIIERMKRYKEPWTVNVIAQAVGEAFFGDCEYLRKTQAVVAAEREFLFDQLSQIRGLTPYPSHAPFLLVRLNPPAFPARALLEKLLRERFLIRDCSNFVGLSHRFFRVAVRKHDENRKLVEALKQIMEEDE